MQADSPFMLAAGLILEVPCVMFDINRSRPMII